MKSKTLLLLGVCVAIMASCSSNSTKSVQDTTTPLSQAGTDNQTGADTLGANAGSAPTTNINQKGKDLVAKTDCIGCHKDHDKLVGPSYASIAAKYPATDKNISYLTAKVIAGGQGVWGSVPMTPHGALAKDDVTEMVKYILTVK
jgi:cytochrome c